MAEKFSLDTIYNRIYLEIQRRSEAQERATHLNILALSVLFGWALTAQSFHTGIYLIAAIINLTFALKWQSEDKNIAGLSRYLREIDAPLEVWQSKNFSSLYPRWLLCGDLLWRLAIFVIPATLSIFLLGYNLYRDSESQSVIFWLGAGAVLAVVLLCFVVRGFFSLKEPWERRAGGN